MKFKEWFLIWPDYIIANSTFTCFGGPQKWHFFINEKENPNCTVESLKEDIRNGWGPAEYEIDYIENLFIDTGDVTSTGENKDDLGIELHPHFYICCKAEVEKDPLGKMIDKIREERRENKIELDKLLERLK